MLYISFSWPFYIYMCIWGLIGGSISSHSFTSFYFNYYMSLWHCHFWSCALSFIGIQSSSLLGWGRTTWPQFNINILLFIFWQLFNRYPLWPKWEQDGAFHLLWLYVFHWLTDQLIETIHWELWSQIDLKFYSFQSYSLISNV